MKFFLLFLILSNLIISSNTPRLDKLEKQSIELNYKLEYNKKLLNIIDNDIKSQTLKLENMQKNYIEKKYYNDIIGRQDKRIEDINSNINLFGILITILFALASIITYWRVKKDAKETSEKYIQNWIETETHLYIKKLKEELTSKSKKEVEKIVQKGMEDIKRLTDSTIDDFKEERKKITKAAVGEIHKLNQIRKDLKLKYIKNDETSNTNDKVNMLVVTLFMEIAELYATNGSFDAAISQYDKILNLDKNNIIAIFNKARILFNNEEYEKSIKEFEKIIDLGKADADVYYNLSICFENKASNNIDSNQSIAKQEFIKSLNYIDMALGIEKNFQFLYNKAYILTDIFNLEKDKNKKNKLYDQIINIYKEAIKLNKENIDDVYTNILELELITNKEFDLEIVKEYKQKFQNYKHIYLKYLILDILKNIRDGKNIEINKILYNYKDICINGWTFEDIEKWINNMDNNKIKTNLKDALKILENKVCSA